MADILLGLVLLLILVGPYYVYALLPYFIQKKYKGRSVFFSVLTYALCIGGITLAYYQQFRFYFPDFLSADDIVFFFRALPLIIVIIIAAIKDYSYRKPFEETEF